MRRGWLLATIWLVALVQAYFISAATASRFSINLLLIVLIFVAINRSLQLGLLSAAWAGLWLDLAAGQFGPRILIFTSLSLAVWWLMRSGLEMERRAAQLSIIGGSALLYNVALLSVTWLVLGQLHWRSAILGWWALEVGLTVIFAWLMGRRLQLITKVA